MSTTKQLTNALLKGIMTDAVALRGISSSTLDGIITTGVYQVVPEIIKAGYPVEAYKYGVLVVFVTTAFLAQVYMPHQVNAGYPLYARVSYKPETTVNWNPWYGFAGAQKAKT